MFVGFHRLLVVVVDHGLHRVRRDGRRVGVEAVPIERGGGGHGENLLAVRRVRRALAGGGTRGVVGVRLRGLRGSESGIRRLSEVPSEVRASVLG